MTDLGKPETAWPTAAPGASGTAWAPAESPSSSAGPAGHSCSLGCNPPAGLLITAPTLCCLLKATIPAARAPVQSTALLLLPSWPAKNQTPRVLLEKKRVLTATKQNALLTLQTPSLFISSLVEAFSYHHTLDGVFHLWVTNPLLLH